jgi:hypothetical protein
MGKSLNLKIAGLFTSQNDFGAKQGMLDLGDNIVVDQQDLAQSRKGFDALAYKFPHTSDRANRFGVYQNTLVAHYGTNSLAYYNPSTGWVVYSGIYDHPDALTARVRFLQSNLNLYFTTSLGIKKLDLVTGTPVDAGIPKALDLAVSLTGSSGFLTSNVVKTISAKTTSSSAILTNVSDSDVTSLLVGMYASGTNIPANAAISDISLSSTVLVTTGNLTAGSTSIANVVSSAGIVAGQIVSGTGLLANTRVVSVSGAGPYTVTVDTAAIQTGTGVALTFRSDNTVTLSQAATGTGTVTVTMANGAQCGYRLIWGKRDANNNVLLGAPSPLTAVTNTTGGTRNTQSVATIPSGITTSHFYQLYRSAATPSASVSPVDQEQLVAEGFPTGTDLTNGYITITDQTPDSLKGESLYAGSDQEGITQANYQPPLAKDFCFYKGSVLYANTSQRQQLKLAIDGVGSPNGVQSGDVITIAGVAFTADTSENTATGHFQVFTSGTPAQNIADTTNSFIRVVNRYSGNTQVYAYLLSGQSDLPGQMLIEARTAGTATFAVTASANGTAWTPDLPTSGTTVSSSAQTETNVIYVAKYGQPEAVPLANRFPVGAQSNAILRIIPLRDYVVIFTTDGIYRLLGNTIESFDPQPFDLTTRLVAPESAVPLGNQAWCLANQGVVSISDGGVQSRSTLQIDDKVRELLGQAIDSVAARAFAVGYETDHRYILALPQNENDTFCTQQYCINYFTEAWTRWTRSCTTGFVHPVEDKLYLGNGSNERVVFERKSNTFRDYVDEPMDITIASSSSTSVVLSDATGINVGDILLQGNSLAEILAVDPASNVLTVDQVVAWSAGAAQYEPAIECTIQWKPAAAGDPTEAKQYAEGQIIFRQATFTECTLSFLTDIDPSFESVTITGVNPGLFGLFQWGKAPWGGVSRSKTLRFLIPANKQYCGSITVKFVIRTGLSSWLLEGISLVPFDEGFELGK